MSYDLFFRPRTGTINSERFSRYFQGRPCFTVTPPQAWYQNDETGVYFVFELKSKDDEENADAYPVALNVNYFRPSYFILEAEPEITRFVREFDVTVLDPQMTGMGEGEYDNGLLVSGWNDGNDFGYSAILRDPGNRKELYTLPSQTLVDAWRWNHGRSALQALFGESKFVPRILFALVDEVVVTAVVWPDGIPIVAPPVDYLIVPRKELAPRRTFRRVEDQTLLRWDKALSILKQHSSRQIGGAYALDYEAPPRDVIGFIESLPADRQRLSVLPPDRVLDREIVARHVA